MSRKKLALAFSRDGFTEDTTAVCADVRCLARGPKMQDGPRTGSARFVRAMKGKFAACAAHIRMHHPRRRADAPDSRGRRRPCCDRHRRSARAARSRAVTAEEVETRLRKTGGTAFSAAHCTITLDGGLAVSAGALNALRREALAQMEAQRTAVPERRVFNFVPPKTVKNSADKPLLTVSLHRAEQLSEELIALAPARVYVPVELLAQLDLAPYRGRTEFFRALAAHLPHAGRAYFCARCSRTPPKKASRACRSPTSATCRSRVDLIASCTAAGR